MKKSFCLLTLLGSLVFGHAQVTSQFTVDLNGLNMVPPDTSTATGFGNLVLTGDSLSYSVGYASVFFFNTGGIHGPASPGATAPVIFDLGPSIIGSPPNPPDLGSGYFNGSIILNGSQANDLRAGLWYVELKSRDLPSGDIRGQIQLVPEPSSAVLLGLAGCAVWLFKRQRNRSS